MLKVPVIGSIMLKIAIARLFTNAFDALVFRRANFAIAGHHCPHGAMW